jgi:alpha-glucosidase (family GH31 glycosyl hydrolase)
LDNDRYPQWKQLVEDLQQNEIAVMSYINPFLVDPSPKNNVQRNMYQEALDKGYFIRHNNGSLYLIQNTSFSAALLDLTNEDCRQWIKKIIINQMIDIGCRGWMADFGEALPFDCVLSDGTDPLEYHNRYPVEWIKLNREAIAQAGLENEVLVFNRAGFTASPKYSTMFWMGDQLTSWSHYDGIKSALTGLLSSGMSGISLNHGDIGGYISTVLPRFPVSIPLLSYYRKPELLQRWVEFYAFTSMFRTHEGNQPDKHAQIDCSPEVLRHFALFSRVYKTLSTYRRTLFQEANKLGYPVVRHPWLVFPEDDNCLDLRWQFFLGADLLVAPVLEPKTESVKVYFPIGEWIRLSTGKSHVTNGEWKTVETPMGNPAAFYRKESSHKELFSTFHLLWK